MIRELLVSIVAAGVSALVTVDDFDQIPVQAPMVRPEPLHQLGDV
ncbi:hypothetical protein [Mesorhizobium sp.]|nr:hypothetical protein [Mesorhizobium sp.]